LVLGVCLLLGGGCAKKTIKDDDWVRVPDSGDPKTITHEVAVGETLTLIADNYYGDPELASKIARENGVTDPARLEAGSVLQLEFTEEEWMIAQKRAAAMNPYNRGVDLMAHGDLQAAEREFRLALEMAPEFVNARYNLALVHLKRGQLAQAEQILSELVAARPNEPDFLFAYGHVQFLQTHFVEATLTFRNLLVIAPDHRRGTFGLARSLQEAGQEQEAVVVWQAYLKLDATSCWADEARRNLDLLQGE
jgi:TolA-binding protein